MRIFALLAVILVYFIGPVEANDSRAAGNFSDLIRQAEKNGPVRVIVELKAGAELDAENSGVSDKRRMAIVSRAQSVFLMKFFKTRIAIEAAAKKRGLKKMSFSPMLAMEVSAAELRRLRNDPLVRRVVIDGLNKPSLDVSVPLIGMTPVFAAGESGSDAIIAVVDTGVKTSHPFIAGTGRIVDEACYSTTSSGYSTVCPNGSSSQTGTGAGVNCNFIADGCEHGTHVAGIALGNNVTNAAGVPSSGVAKGASLMAVQVFSYSPTNGLGAFNSDILLGLERVYAVRNNFGSKKIRSINMSLGDSSINTGTCDTNVLYNIIHQLRGAGILTVIAAGNDGKINSMGAPACISDAVSVAASNDADTTTSFTNISTQTTVFAPGASINSSSVQTDGQSFFENLSGTSMAAPHVAGALAVLMDAFPNKPVSEIISALTSTGPMIADVVWTKPRIQVDKAYAKLAAVLTATPASAVTIVNDGVGTDIDSFNITIGTSNTTYPLTWSLSGVPSWLTPSATSGSTGTTVTFTVNAPSGQSANLSATISIDQTTTTGPAVTIPVALNLDKPTLVLGSASSVNLVRKGNAAITPGSFSVTVNSSKANQSTTWSLSGVPSWLTPSATTGTTGTAVTFDVVEPDNQVADLAATLLFTQTSAGTSTISVPVTVDYQGTTLVLGSASPINLVRKGNAAITPGSFSVTVNSSEADQSTTWSLSGVPSWLTPSATTGTTGTAVSFDVVEPASQVADLAATLLFTQTSAGTSTVSVPVSVDYQAPVLTLKALTATTITIVNGKPVPNKVKLALKINAGTSAITVKGKPSWLNLVGKTPVLGTTNKQLIYVVKPPRNMRRDLTATLTFTLASDPTVSGSVKIKLKKN